MGNKILGGWNGWWSLKVTERQKYDIHAHTWCVPGVNLLFTFYLCTCHSCVCVFFVFFSNCLHTFSFGIDYCCIPSWVWYYTIVMTAFFIHIPDWENLWCWTDSWSWSHCATSRGQNQTAWPQQRYNTRSAPHQEYHQWKWTTASERRSRGTDRQNGSMELLGGKPGLTTIQLQIYPHGLNSYSCQFCIFSYCAQNILLLTNTVQFSSAP